MGLGAACLQQHFPLLPVRLHNLPQSNSWEHETFPWKVLPVYFTWDFFGEECDAGGGIVQSYSCHLNLLLGGVCKYLLTDRYKAYENQKGHRENSPNCQSRGGRQLHNPQHVSLVFVCFF